ncbi:CatB-related O-acetyltransferase [Aliishimia ponticola]|uniref:CatB-related O-acetyltransferase n=1 Tax=Aliishimia ponticola TaxID=2499833 RepID=A0A4V3XKK6_9RHOB|nr:CatB-related O-acetyltransferase [Aliishimia ponticola]THH37263.1 CatB-related O-acetyltransferase [Aliishimia ponticola]
MIFPDPARTHPVTLPDGTVHPGTVFLSRVIDHPNFHVGDFTYASDFAPPSDWASQLAPYLFPGGTEHLHIGKYCQIAHAVRFLTAGANHAQDGLTCFPFPIFDPATLAGYQPDTRDTVIGHDIWFGYGALILPGAHIGHGAIIGAGAVVRGTVPPYAIVTGNPGTVIRHRFDTKTAARLLELAWWDWPPEIVAKARPALMAGDLAALERAAP